MISTFVGLLIELCLISEIENIDFVCNTFTIGVGSFDMRGLPECTFRAYCCSWNSALNSRKLNFALLWFLHDATLRVLFTFMLFDIVLLCVYIYKKKKQNQTQLNECKSWLQIGWVSYTNLIPRNRRSQMRTKRAHAMMAMMATVPSLHDRRGSPSREVGAPWCQSGSSSFFLGAICWHHLLL